MSNERRGFEPYQVELVYRNQDGVCSKCSKPLANGFHRHHKNGNPTDNSITNLELVCPECHGGEMGKTLREKKLASLEDTTTLIRKALDGQLSGAAVEKVLDTIKLHLSLTQQIYGADIEKAPSSVRIEENLIASGALMKEFERGFFSGMERAVELVEKLKGAKRP